MGLWERSTPSYRPFSYLPWPSTQHGCNLAWFQIFFIYASNSLRQFCQQMIPAPSKTSSGSSPPQYYSPTRPSLGVFAKVAM